MIQMKKTLGIAGIIAIATAPAMADIASTDYVQSIVNNMIPQSGTVGHVLKKTELGMEWAAAPSVPENVLSNNAADVDSIAIGDGAIADVYSIAIGPKNTANSEQDSAVGYKNTANGMNSSAFGNSNTALGEMGVAFGYKNEVTGDRSVTVGRHNITDREDSSAFGYENEVHGNRGSAFGDRNKANGMDSSAFGGGNTASGMNSSAFGTGNTASGESSSAFGSGNTASGKASSVFGFHGTTSEDAVFSTQIGPGTVNTANTFSVGIGDGLSYTETWYGDELLSGTPIAYPLLVSGGLIPAGRLTGQTDGVDNNGVENQLLASDGNGGMKWVDAPAPSLASLLPELPSDCDTVKCALVHDNTDGAYKWEVVKVSE